MGYLFFYLDNQAQERLKVLVGLGNMDHEWGCGQGKKRPFGCASEHKGASRIRRGRIATRAGRIRLTGG